MDIINLRGVVAEDFSNYKVPAMFLITSYCDFKCCNEAGLPHSVCQNEPMVVNTSIKDYKMDTVIQAYIQNPITKAIVFGGLEPMLQYDELKLFIYKLRYEYDCLDPVVIYTGYNKEELSDEIAILGKYKNIIMKYGRYRPNNKPHYDEVLGVNLISDNQYGEALNEFI